MKAIQPDPDDTGPLDAPTIDYAFDAGGRLESLTDPVGNTTSWLYDMLGRVTSETNELNKTRSFAYDGAHRLIERTDRLGRVIEFDYNVFDQVIEERWYDGVSLVRTLLFDYNDAGELLEATDPAATYGFTRDDLGRITSRSQSFAGFTHLIDYESDYNAAGQRTELRSIVGGTADFANTYLYDNLHRITRLEQGEQTSGNAVAEKRIDFAYNALGQFAKITRYADLAGSDFVANTLYGYDHIGRLTKLLHTLDATLPGSGWGTDPLAGYQFAWDAGSRITSIDSYIEGLTEYDYDNTSQLTGADHASQTDEVYEYDENGNRTMTGYSVGDNNQLTSNGTYNYTYDDEGNRLTQTENASGHVRKYEWDHRNRLTKVTQCDDEENVLWTVQYAYDAFNRLIRRTYDADGPGGSAAVDAFFSWEADQIVLQFEGTTASDLAHRNLWNHAAIDQILAVEDVSSLASHGEVLWPLTDHLGTIRDIAQYDDVLDETTIVNHRVFDSYGQLISESDSDFALAIGFTGVYVDGVSSIHYHRERWYDGAIGQWLSDDPIGFAGGDSNLRRYASNAPVQFTDPQGLSILPLDPINDPMLSRIAQRVQDDLNQLRSRLDPLYQRDIRELIECHIEEYERYEAQRANYDQFVQFLGTIRGVVREQGRRGQMFPGGEEAEAFRRATAAWIRLRRPPPILPVEPQLRLPSFWEWYDSMIRGDTCL